MTFLDPIGSELTDSIALPRGTSRGTLEPCSSRVVRRAIRSYSAFEVIMPLRQPESRLAEYVVIITPENAFQPGFSWLKDMDTGSLRRRFLLSRLVCIALLRVEVSTASVPTSLNSGLVTASRTLDGCGLE